MIKSNKRKILLILALTCVAFTCMVLLATGFSSKSAYANQIEPNQPISANYALGDTFTPPQAKITYGGAEYDATVVSVKYPDGKAYKTSSYVLSVPGEYIINYSANANGVTVLSSLSFNVSGSAYDVGGRNSSASYITINNTDAYGEEIATTTSGLKVSLAVGDTFTYKKPIDLNGKTSQDKLIELYVLPKNIGKADARILRVRLTDAYDPNNYVDIVTYGNYGDEDEVKGWALYSAAAANGQPLTGLHYKAPLENSPSAIYYLDGKYTVNPNIGYNSGNGYPTGDFSLVAKNGYGSGLYSIAMDYAEKRVYGPKPYSSLSNGIIVDLDEPLFFTDLWQGFTTGEVYLSIWADNYVSSTFDFLIKSIDGEELSNPYYNDQAQPIIDVDIPKTGVPNAVVDKKYKLFDATAKDAVDGNITPSVFVYRNYYSYNPVVITVTDGGFIPDKACAYTIVYKATDKAGNTAIKLVDLTAKEQSLLNIGLDLTSVNVKAGERCLLKTPEISGQDGQTTLTVSVVMNEQTTVILPDQNGEYSFIPMASGEYTVKYLCSDYNNTVTKEYTLNVQANTTPLIIDDVYLPPVFVKNIGYTLPAFYGYDFSDGTKKQVTADISYAFDGGSFTEYTAGQEIVINATQTVTVVYSVGDNAASKKTYVVPVADVSGEFNGTPTELNTKNYFYGKDFTIQTDLEEGINYVTSAEQANLLFVNKLLAVDFSVGFKVKEMDCEELTFTLTDSQNKNEKIVIAIKADGEEAIVVSINDEIEQKISIPLLDTAINIAYANKTKEITIAGITFKLEEFNGFTSKKIYFELDVSGNQGTTTVNFANINGQVVSDSVLDMGKPNYHLEVNKGQKSVGEKLVISEFIAQDVFRFKTNLKLSVKDQNGNAMIATDLTEMLNVTDFSKAYEIVLDSVGTYTVSYEANDGAMGKATGSFEVVVKDKIAPTITLKNPVTTARVGANVTVASYTATDATDRSLTVRICVQRPDMSVENLSGKSFKATTAGTYTVMYYVSDATGNSAFAFYEIVVK